MKKLTTILLIGSVFTATSCLNEDDGIIEIPPLEGSTIAPKVGGATQPNQVWVDLSNVEQIATNRTAWDLGFYTGNEFRVILNNSILMAAASVDSNDIDAVTGADFSEVIGIIDPGAGFPAEYIDDVKGDYLNDGTAIAEISADDSENKVYLVKLGYGIFEGNVPPYSAYIAGESRGYKKVRILRHGPDSYKIQYADPDDSTHQEFIVEKDPAYHFTFFSFDTEDTVMIQPAKTNWDLCFTVWNNVIEGYGTYTYSDFVINNKIAGVGSYMVVTDALTLEEDYTDFSITDVDESLFGYDDQRAIGSTWRSTVSGTSSNPTVYGDRFYVIKDAEGLVFKLRFLRMLGDNNERGHPEFEYEPL